MNRPVILTVKTLIRFSTSLLVCNKSRVAPWCSSLMIQLLPGEREGPFACSTVESSRTINDDLFYCCHPRSLASALADGLDSRGSFHRHCCRRGAVRDVPRVSESLAWWIDAPRNRS